MNETISNWDIYIDSLVDLPNLSQYWEQDLVRQIKRNIPKNTKRVLEVGCSNGRWLRWFNREYISEVYGTDLNPTGFTKKDVNFAIGDALNLPFKDASFDVVYSLGLLEHFIKKEKYQILKEQVRILCDDGFVICQVPNLQLCMEFFWIKYFYDYKQGYKHFKTTSKELKKYFNKLGLEMILSDFTGCFRELSVFRRFRKVDFLKQLISDEILIICKKKK
jgi:ubiquinone/menaquinone biosynthesis C-methylase UbiE